MTKVAAAHRKAGVEALLRRPYGALQLEQYRKSSSVLGEQLQLSQRSFP